METLITISIGACLSFTFVLWSRIKYFSLLSILRECKNKAWFPALHHQLAFQGVCTVPRLLQVSVHEPSPRETVTWVHVSPSLLSPCPRVSPTVFSMIFASVVVWSFFNRIFFLFPCLHKTPILRPGIGMIFLPSYHSFRAEVSPKFFQKSNGYIVFIARL